VCDLSISQSESLTPEPAALVLTELPVRLNLFSQHLPRCKHPLVQELSSSSIKITQLAAFFITTVVLDEITICLRSTNNHRGRRGEVLTWRQAPLYLIANGFHDRDRFAMLDVCLRRSSWTRTRTDAASNSLNGRRDADPKAPARATEA